MKKSKSIVFAALTFFTVGSMFAMASSNSTDLISSLMSSAQEVPNVANIRRSSARDTTRKKVTATTEKGNTVDFSYNRFDTRNSGTDPWDYGICFYKTENNLGGYITNDTAMYSVSSIKIYGWSQENPELTTLTSYKFNIYYGFEPLVINRNNSAKVTITDGQYTFESGYEPSYIAIECIENFDALVGRIEISYKCSPVLGSISDLGPAYKYDAEGKLFTSDTGAKIPYNITQQAPWVHLSGLDDASKMKVRYNGTYDTKTHVYSTTGPSYFDLKFNSGAKIEETDTRKIVSATLTLSINGSTGWGSWTDLYFGVNGNVAGYTYARLSSLEILGGKNTWESNSRVISVVDENGTDMTGKSIRDKRITIDFDASSCPNDIVNVTLGTSNENVNITIHDISVKATACGHAGYEEHSNEHAYRYEAAGTYFVCPDCGDSPKTRGVITTPAPWLRLSPTSSKGVVINPDGTITSTGGWGNQFVYTLPSDLEGRTELAITFGAPKSSWDYYFQIGNQSGNQIVTASAKINYGQNAMVSAIYGEFEQDLHYNPSTYSISEAVGASKVTIVYDLTKASSTITGAALSLTLHTEGIYSCFDVDLRTPCDHSNVESFSTYNNCGERCADCGIVTNSYVKKIDTYIPSAHVGEGVMTYQSGVRFQDTDCFKITTTKYTQTEEMGWAVNYKVYFRNLIKNAKAAGKTTIKITFFVEASTQYNIRFIWGVGNNVSGAQADHYNDPLTMVGSNLVPSHSRITDTKGTAAKCYANQWRVLVLDISSDDFAAADVSDFWICGNLDVNGTKDHYPINTYISNISCEA